MTFREDYKWYRRVFIFEVVLMYDFSKFFVCVISVLKRLSLLFLILDCLLLSFLYTYVYGFKSPIINSFENRTESYLRQIKWKQRYRNCYRKVRKLRLVCIYCTFEQFTFYVNFTVKTHYSKITNVQSNK